MALPATACNTTSQTEQPEFSPYGKAFRLTSLRPQRVIDPCWVDIWTIIEITTLHETARILLDPPEIPGLVNPLRCTYARAYSWRYFSSNLTAIMQA